VQNYRNLPLSNGIKIVSVLQRLHGEIGRTISDVQKRYEQTDRQTNTVIEDLEHVLALLKRLGLTHSFAARGR